MEVRRWVLVVWGATILVLVAAAKLHLQARPPHHPLGAFGLEWTERYGTVVTCENRTMLLTRMHRGGGAFVPVLRYRGDRRAHVLWNLTRVAKNPTLFCHNDTTYVVGSKWVEFTGSGSAYTTPDIVPLHSASRGRSLGVPPCTEPYRNAPRGMCKFDSKFSLVDRDGVWYLYIRRNPCYDGGCRHVQVTTSADAGRTWTPFTPLTIDNVTIARDVNIYFFDVHNDLPGRLRARFPAVFGAEAGIYETTSADGVHWTSPVRTVAARPVGQRSMLHPVGARDVMKINLHEEVHDVEMLTPDGVHLCDFHTEHLS